MKAVATILPLVALTSAIVVPDEQVFAQIPIEDHASRRNEIWDKLPSFEKIGHRVSDTWRKLPEQIDDVFARVHEVQDDITERASSLDYTSWIEDGLKRWEAGESEEPPHGPPHHGPPDHRHPPGPPPPKHGRHPPGPPPPKDGRRPFWRWPKPAKKHHKAHHHHSSNKTIYQLISGSNYTTNLTKLINEDKDLVKLLNSTDGNFTLFAPTDYAFSKIPDHGKKPSKDIIKKVLLYHVLPDKYPALKLLFAHTAPTLLKPASLGDHPQRVLVKFLGLLRGVRVNYYIKVVAPDIPAANGIIHATSSILLPPPPALGIITHLPGIFSTFELALRKTDLYDALNTTDKDTVGGTLFAPTNNAFKKLGPRANGFLFGRFGTKYLKALLEYHLVPKRTLYSTAFYDGKKDKSDEVFGQSMKHNCHKQANKDVKAQGGYVHIDLPTALEGKTLSIDLIRRGPFIDFKVNAFVHVAVQDGLARDGVIQTVNDILLPPKRPGSHSEEAADFWDGQEIEVEDLVARLNPYVDAEDETEFFDDAKYEF